jgi:hypothetical protein
MADAIFLSAGVPDPKRCPEHAATADIVAITSAVSALVYVILGRRPLVWGGQPAITPMIWVVAQELRVEYKDWVKLYQSRYFEDEFPEDNERFQNVIYTDHVSRDREKSLLAMRERMFSETSFKAAVFIGGMNGVVDEYELFCKRQPSATILPILSTGGAVLSIAERLGTVARDLRDDLDYVSLFHRHLAISVREERFPSPKEQPVEIEHRYWRPSKPGGVETA